MYHFRIRIAQITEKGFMVVDLLRERMESLKAGVVSALLFNLCYTTSQIVLEWKWQLELWDQSHWWLTEGIALLSGFLFGVTYRYIIRRDDNNHLKDGAVLAFSLIKGMSSIELLDNSLSIGGYTLITLLSFTLSRWGLDFAIDRNWLKRFD